LNIIVGMADMQVSNNPEATLVTYSLGSCVGVTIYDPVFRVGGMLHYMLPDSSLDPEKARERPFMFADTGIPLLFKSAYELGAKKSRIKVRVAGGAQILDDGGYFNIGKRNYAALRKMFWRNNVMIENEDIGGTINRTIYFSISDGSVSLKVSGGERKKL
jgi:chemotaxis protein CheD